MNADTESGCKADADGTQGSARSGAGADSAFEAMMKKRQMAVQPEPDLQAEPQLDPPAAGAAGE